MYDGYLALGSEEAFNVDDQFELINTARVGAYIDTWNQRIRQGSLDAECIDWFKDCDECGSAEFLFTDGKGYISPKSDPAPWYDPAVRDSENFFGIVGLEVTGAEDSTRTATVQASVSGGGAVSRLRFGPRSIIVRGLAVAADSCALEVGLNWLRCQYETTVTDCGEDFLWYLDCCPNCATDPNAPPASPCWPDDYAELKNGPSDCPAGTWWPSTYAELRDGPPESATEWCTWIVIYRQLTDGLPQFGCDIQECLVPYLRNFRNVRVVSGPTILNRRTMSTQGEIAEVEFEIACGDPHEYTPMEVVLAGERQEPNVAVADGIPPEPIDNPFAPQPIDRGPQVGGVSMPTQWMRAQFEIPGVEYGKRLPTTVPAISIAPEGEMGVTRVGVWVGDDLIGGYTVPFIPSNGLVDVDAAARQTITEYMGDVRTQNGFARNYKGVGMVTWPEVPTGDTYTITVDQAADVFVPFDVEVQAAEKGCA